MAVRKFYITEIIVTVISEDDPLDWDNLADVNDAITNGDCSGTTEEVSCTEVDAATAAKLMIKQESDPGFFGLDDDGNPLEED